MKDLVPRLPQTRKFVNEPMTQPRAVSFSHFDRIWESEAPAEPLHFPQITDWLGRSLALPRE